MHSIKTQKLKGVIIKFDLDKSYVENATRKPQFDFSLVKLEKIWICILAKYLEVVN